MAPEGVWCYAGRTGQNKVGPMSFCENISVWVFALLDNEFVMSSHPCADSSVLGATCNGAQHIKQKFGPQPCAVIMLWRYCLASWVMRVCHGMWPGNRHQHSNGGVLGFHPMDMVMKAPWIAWWSGHWTHRVLWRCTCPILMKSTTSLICGCLFVQRTGLFPQLASTPEGHSTIDYPWMPSWGWSPHCKTPALCVS